MPLGIEQNNIAPQLIQNSGAALVQGIRQIGQQISGHLTEIQTKRDLGAMAQEMQGINVQSNEFPVQLTQMLSRHPLAAKDERGQMALSILGKAHGQWQAGEAEARAFNRAMAMQGYRDRSATTRAEAAEKVRANRPINTSGGLYDPTLVVTDPLTGEEVTGGIVPGTAPNRVGSNRPTVLAPGAKAIDVTGKVLAENPKVVGLTPGQAATDARLLKKSKIDLLMRQDKQLQTDISERIRRLDAIQAQDLKLSGEEAKVGNAKKDFLVTTAKAIQDEVAALRKRRDEIQNGIQSIEAAAVEVNDADAEAEILPPLTSTAAAPASVEMIAVIDPQGRPGKVKSSQLEAALQNGYKRR